MSNTDVARFIIVVLAIILRLYNVVSENVMIFALSNDNYNDILLCNNGQWAKYIQNVKVLHITADVKQRVLYWTTKEGFFSSKLDGKKTVVNLSQKFEEGLVYQDFFSPDIARTVMFGTIFKVHNGQIIFTAIDWGLMSFDIKTNRRLYRLNLDKAYHAGEETNLNFEIYNNKPCLYWVGPRTLQISRYILTSALSRVIVEWRENDWFPVAVSQGKIYWENYDDLIFITDMNLQNRQTLINNQYEYFQYSIIEEVFYYSYIRNVSSTLSDKIKPLEPYFNPCYGPLTRSMAVVPTDNSNYMYHQVDIDNAVKTNNSTKYQNGEHDIWSTVGWSLGCAFTLVILFIICFCLVKMVRRKPDNSQQSTATRGKEYDLPEIGKTSENIYSTCE